MNITITIPIHTDKPLNREESQTLRTHIERALDNMIDPLRSEFDKDARMLGTVCRFAFGVITATVTDE